MLFSQSGYLDKPKLMAMADSCLAHTYNFSFTEAHTYQQKLEQLTPNHPAPYFLEALIIYWEEFPLTPEKERSDRFIEQMEICVQLAEDLLSDEEYYLEGVFFELFGRAFQAMFWADNGKSGKVIPDLGPMYLQTKEGFLLKDQFIEFYFSTGLYNYYIEAYPEAHPIYKPVLAFMQKGDRELGLRQLNYAIEKTTFLKVEALLFMSLIQLNYEQDLKTAALYAERLHQSYARNIYYQGLLAVIQLHRKEYHRAEGILILMEGQTDDYSRMIKAMVQATLSENDGNRKNAEIQYLSTIELAASIGPFADLYQAIAYMGLSRLSADKGMKTQAKRYARNAENYTDYKFILGE
jgi:hypothetical protein